MNIIVDYSEVKDTNEENEKGIGNFKQSPINDVFLFNLLEINEADYLKQFYELFNCLEISIDNKLLEQAWQEYYRISQQILLEGQNKIWMICAFYTSIWQSKQSNEDQFFGYSILKLLNLNGLSVMEFLTKLNRWSEMIIASPSLVNHINYVQSSLAVSIVIYKKLLSVFRYIFLNDSKQSVSSKSSITTSNTNFEEITSSQIFEFIWIMFITFKKQFENVENDLINSFQLLLCITELLFEDLREAKLTHLYNPEFEKSLKVENSEKSVLEYLCKIFNSSVLEAKHFRLHCFFSRLRNLIENKVLIGNTEQGGIFANIKTNKNTLNKIYEEIILNKNMIDERIFLTSTTDNMNEISEEDSKENAIKVLREKYCFDSRNELINGEFALRILTQNCLDQLNEERLNQGLASVKAEKPYKDDSFVLNRQHLNKDTSLNNNNNKSIYINKIRKRELSSKHFDETIKLGRFEIKKKLKMVI